MLLYIKLYWSINIYYPFRIVCPNPLENIIWDLIWEYRTSDLIWDHIWDPLIYKMEDDITYIRSIWSKVWNTHKFYKPHILSFSFVWISYKISYEYVLFYSRLKNTDRWQNILGNETKSGNTACVRILYLNGIN